ncbi:hypothetical protein [Haloferula sp. BvORR071]|uniref:hypothetical protein n=1 Tax=Haloferula sp. BvORR071 TaxID=1396141 RepID=UPI000559379A|nr:hypothetical protein [Haloferula sp. BvORR071]
MKENHEKTGYSAFILSLLGFLTLGLTVAPALACALISKRQSLAAGKPTDGFATSAVVISLFLMGLIMTALIGGAAIWAGADFGFEVLTMEVLQALMLATITMAVVCAVLMLARTKNQHEDERIRLRKLAGRGGGSSAGPSRRWHRRRVTATAPGRY